MFNAIIGAGRRCAVDLKKLDLPVNDHTALEILRTKGYSRVEVDLDSLGTALIGKSRYRRGANSQDAPEIVDCSSLTKWLYAQNGIWLPRHSIDQRDYLGEAVTCDNAQSGDLAFVRGYRNYYWSDPNDAVGHVGMVTARRTVIHAASAKAGIVESALDSFLGKEQSGIRRFPNFSNLITLESPPNRIVECSSAFRWLVLQNL